MVYANFSSNLPTGLQHFEFVDLNICECTCMQFFCILYLRRTECPVDTTTILSYSAIPWSGVASEARQGVRASVALALTYFKINILVPAPEGFIFKSYDFQCLRKLLPLFKSNRNLFFMVKWWYSFSMYRFEIFPVAWWGLLHSLWKISWVYLRAARLCEHSNLVMFEKRAAKTLQHGYRYGDILILSDIINHLWVIFLL